MFWTVFFAVLLALIVYEIFKNFPELFIVIRKILKRILIIWLWIGVILWIYLLVDYYWKDLKEILLVILGLIVIGWIYIGVSFLYRYTKQYIKYKKRKKLGLIKEGVKISSFLSEEYEKERYNKLSKKQKEIEDERAIKWPRIMFFCLIAIPILLLAVIIISLIVEAVKDFL